MDKFSNKLQILGEEEKKKLKKLLLEKQQQSNTDSQDDKPGFVAQNSNCLDWMYKGEKPDIEDYLLGKKIDKHIENENDIDTQQNIPGASFEEVIKRRSDLDMQAKMREDPLFMIKQQEDDAKRKLLKNPIKMKKIEKLLEKDAKQKKHKKKKHKKDTEGDMIMQKYLEILQQKAMSKDGSDFKEHNLNINSANSLSSSQKHTLDLSQKEISKSKHRHRSRSNSPKNKQHHSKSKRKYSPDNYNKHSHHSRSHRDYRSRSPRGGHRSKNISSESTRKLESKPLDKPTKPSKLTNEEREARLREMINNAEWRENQRHSNLKKYKADEESELKRSQASSSGDNFLKSMMLKHNEATSVEDRLKRNIHNIQRTKADLSKHFHKR